MHILRRVRASTCSLHHVRVATQILVSVANAFAKSKAGLIYKYNVIADVTMWEGLPIEPLAVRDGENLKDRFWKLDRDLCIVTSLIAYARCMLHLSDVQLHLCR